MTHLGCEASTYHLKRTSQTVIENPLKDIPVIAKGGPIVRKENFEPSLAFISFAIPCLHFIHFTICLGMHMKKP
jgi:hypothetical protein